MQQKQDADTYNNLAIVSMLSLQDTASQETAQAGIKVARIKRKLDFNYQAQIKQEKEGFILIYNKLKHTRSI